MAVNGFSVSHGPEDLLVKVDCIGLFAVVIHLLKAIGFLGVAHVVFSQADHVSNRVRNGRTGLRIRQRDSARVALTGGFLQDLALFRSKAPDQIIHGGVGKPQLLNGIYRALIRGKHADLLCSLYVTGEKFHVLQLLLPEALHCVSGIWLPAGQSPPRPADRAFHRPGP